MQESTGTLQVQGLQATTYKAILNNLTIGADKRNLNSHHLVNTNNMNNDQTETWPASAEVSALVDLSHNIVTSSEFSREIDQIWSEITSIPNRFGFLEKPRESDMNNAQLTTVKRPQRGPPEDFQPIRNRFLNKEMNMRTSWETVLFLDWLLSILNL